MFIGAKGGRRRRREGKLDLIFKIDISNTLRGCVAKVKHERQTIPLKVLWIDTKMPINVHFRHFHVDLKTKAQKATNKGN